LQKRELPEGDRKQMKLSIIQSEEYPRHELEVRTWFAEKNGFAHLQKSEIMLIDETEKAYRIAFMKGGESWIPKSLCKIIKREETSLGMF